MNTFEELALPLRDGLLRAAMNLTHSDADAEDLVQDTYLLAFRYFQQFKEGTNFRAWIFTILRNTFISSLRRSQRRPAHMDLATLELLMPEDHPHKETELAENVRFALCRLPDDMRQVVVLSHIKGYLYREIAELLGCPIGTVMSRMFRAHRQLQEHLKEVA